MILPSSHLFPHNPRNLPHAFLVAEKPNKKKAGRKSKKEKGQIALAGIKTLEGIVENSHDLDIPEDEMELTGSYENVKQRLMASVPDDWNNPPFRMPPARLPTRERCAVFPVKVLFVTVKVP